MRLGTPTTSAAAIRRAAAFGLKEAAEPSVDGSAPIHARRNPVVDTGTERHNCTICTRSHIKPVLRARCLPLA
jgi:hypothetical protein